MINVPDPGESVCVPPLCDWRKLAERQRAEKPGLDSLRDAWREELLALAVAHTVSLGLPVPSIDPKAPFILSGHQPYLYHPGVLYKYRLLTLSARAGLLALNISVDTDVSDGFAAKIPSFEGKYRKFTRYLAPSAIKSFYCDVVSDKSAFAVLVSDVERDLGSVPESVFDFGKKFLRDELLFELPDKTADAMTILRRRYAGGWEGAVLEAPLSEICGTKGYFEFTYGLLSEAEKFADIFNVALGNYRAEHKLRSTANPFPDVAKAPNGVETLFWLVKGRARETLSVSPGTGLTINGVGEAYDSDSLMALFQEKGWRLWPKAVVLSLMNRLYLGDLFVHGLGGAKYDRITDEVIRGFYQLEPPPFATASLSLSAETLENPAHRLLELRQKLREMDFHPEAYLENPPVDLLAEKKKLTEEIKIPGANKKEMGRRLGEINETLKAGLGSLKTELTEKIASLESEQNRYDVLADRELPFFLFPPERFDVD
jgi:hypothetical protein